MLRLTRLSSLAATAAIAVAATGVSLHAQSLTDFCPDSDAENASVLIGNVSDPDAGMILPGAEVIATWTEDDATKEAKAMVGVDGRFTLCMLPRATKISVHAAFAGRAGTSVDLQLVDPIGQYDLTLSLMGGGGEGEEAPPERQVSDEEIKASGGGRVMGRAMVDEDDLAKLPDMSLWEFLNRHTLVRLQGPGGQELYIEDRGAVVRAIGNRFVPGYLYVDDRREFDSLGFIRSTQIGEIQSLEVLSSTDTSARYGGDGRIPAVAIRMKRQGG